MMNAKWWLCLLTCALVASAAACAGGGNGGEDPANNGGTNNGDNNGFDGECQRDVDCDAGQFCSTSNTCEDAACQRDADCDVGLFCQIDTGMCVAPECLRNSECATGEYCDRVERKCKAGCGDNSDCGDNEVCNPNTNACEENNECVRDGDCGNLEICLENKCVSVECVSDAQCDTGEVCDQPTNKCVPAEGFCDQDSDCAAGEKCDLDGNVCVEISGCTDATCPQGTFCDEGTGECWACRNDSDCRENDDDTAECNLNTHTCEEVDTRCTSDSDCTGAQTCNRVTGDCEEPEVCQPDSFEPNNMRDAASEIGDGDFGGLRICEGDVDWFAFQVGAGDSLELNLAFAHANGNLDMELLDPSGARFGVSSSNSDNERIFAENLPLSGTYRLRVFGFEGATNDYALQVSLTQRMDPTCTDDGFEENDAVAAAAPIGAQTFENLVVCPGDPDYYKVRVERGERLNVEATFAQADGDLDLTILAPDGETVLVRGLTNNDNESVRTEEVAVSGDYIIVVAGVDPATGNNYSLNVTKTEAPVVNTCMDDDSEDNDARDQATTIAPGLIDNRRICPGDADWYAIGLNAGDDIRVEIGFTHADGDLDLALFQPENPEPIATSLTQSDDEEVGFSDVPASGVYLVRVTGANPEASNDYIMLVERTEPQNETCTDDAMEDNDNRTQPHRIQEGVLQGTVCSGDEDWFSIHVNAGATLDLLLAPNGGNLDLEAFDTNGQSLGTSSNESGDEELSITAPRSGRYLVRVHGPRGAEASYELLSTVGDAPCSDDSSEENDSRADAELTDFGTLNNRFVCSNDDDWYAVELNPNDGLTATAFFQGQQADIDIAIHNEAGQILALSTSITDNEEATVGSVAEGGLYYVRVYGFRGASAPYDLTLTRIDGGTTCVDDNQEPNDSRERAIALTGPRDFNFLHSCPSDRDWFSIELAEREVLDVMVTFSHAEGDIDMAVFDSNGAIIASGYSTDDNEAVLVRAPSAGLYYVQVYGFDNDIDSDYALSIDILPPETCIDDNFEENDTRETASPIVERTYRGLGMCKPTDEDESDWYSIQLDEVDILTATIIFEHDVNDLDLELYNEEGRRLTRSTSRRDIESVEWLVETAGTYYLRVYPYFFLPVFDEANSEYDMIINID